MTLTSRERLDRLFRQREVDRPGVVARGVDAVRPKNPSYAELRAYTMAHADIEDEWFVASLVSGKPAHADLLAELFPDRLRMSREYVDERFDRCTLVVQTPRGPLEHVIMAGKGVPPYMTKHLIADPEDARRFLSLPEQPYHYDAESYFRKVRELGDRGVVLAKPLGANPAGAVAVLLGMETFALWSVERRELLEELVAHQYQFQLKIVKELLDRGIGPYFGIGGQEYLTPPMHGRRDFEELNTKYDRPITDLIHNAGGLMHVHCHGPLAGVLDLFPGIADVLHPIEPPPMGNVTARQAKSMLRGRVCIEGNLQIGDFYTKSPEEIADATRELIRDAFDDGTGLIVCPSASPYVQAEGRKAYGTYRAMIDAVTGWS